ncbi:MAG: Crp/Fnr family transcriptional regulator [bacterium]
MEETQKCLKDLIVFSLLEDKEVKSICQKAYERKYNKGEIIFFEDDSEKKLYFLTEGKVKLTMMSPEGKEKVLTILQEGDIFGEISLFDEDPHPLSAEVQEECKLLIVSWKDLESVILNNPSLALKLITALAKKTRLLASQVRELVFHDAEGRLAALLNRFSRQFGFETEKGTIIEVILTHQEIANLLGTSRVTVTKLMNKFIKNGIIKIKERKIVIQDKKKLEDKVKGSN